MKTQEEIEQLANEWSLINSDDTMETNSSLNKGYIKGYTQCQEDNKDEYRWTYSEIFDACFPTLGRGGDWAAIAKRLTEKKENK